MAMAKFRCTAHLLLATIVLLGSAHAASTERTTDLELEAPLTADSLAQAALARNAGVKALEEAARAAKFRIAPAGALEDPTLRYSVPPATFGERFGRLDFAQPLPWPGKLALREEAARHDAEAARADTADLRLQVAAAAKSLFAEWAYVQRALSINADHQALLEDLRRAAESAYAAGRTGQRDVLQAEVARTRLQAEAVDLKRRRYEVQARINALLNREPQASLPPPAALPPLHSLPTANDLQRIAAGNHPELSRVQARIGQAQARLDLAKKDYYPDFRLMTGYNSLWDNTDKRWTVGIGINLPLNYGNKRGAAEDAARAELMRSRWQLSDREARLLSELEVARAAVAETAAVIDLYQTRLLPLAQDNLSAARADYSAGAGAFLDVIDAERQQLRVEDLLARARADYQRRLAELERWLGTTLADAASLIPSENDR